MTEENLIPLPAETEPETEPVAEPEAAPAAAPETEPVAVPEAEPVAAPAAAPDNVPEADAGTESDDDVLARQIAALKTEQEEAALEAALAPADTSPQKKRHPVLKGLLIALLCLLVILGAVAAWLYYHDRQMSGVVPQGVTFAQTSFGGLANAEVRPKVESILNDLNSQQIDLQVASAQLQTPIKDFVSFDTTQIVDTITSTRAGIPLVERIRYEWSWQLRSWSWHIPYLDTTFSRTVPLSYSIDTTAVTSYVDTLSQKSATTAVNARLVLPEGSLVPTITPEVNGTSIVTTATVSQLSAAIKAAIKENKAQSITVAIKSGAPDVTAESLKDAPSIVVLLSAKKMELYRGSTLVRSMVTATGKPGYETKPDDYFIGAMRYNPTWINPYEDWSMNMPERISGPNGPLGARAMNVVKRNEAGDVVDYGYRIHGGTVGAGASSHGCLHLSNADVIWLYDQVALGTPVFIRP